MSDSTPEKEICFLEAVELSKKIRHREISATEVMEACLGQIGRINRKVNAIITLHPGQALEQAKQADLALAKGEAWGPLHGFPHAVKDLADAQGFKTTYGSRIYRDYFPAQDSLFVERLREAGAIIIGKTNTPEFGAGSQTFNELFGATRNPYDLTKTCGGSSGGAAVALACGMVPLADGSDLGGSLRNPASFCNVVGFRPSIGRVPAWPSDLGRFSLAVEGPMARTVSDVALLLSIMAGPDPRDPNSIQEPGSNFRKPLEADFRQVRLAWSPDLGQYPVEATVKRTCEKALGTFEHLGCHVEEAWPDFHAADGIFQTLRAWEFAYQHRHDLDRHGDLIKDTVVWNIEKGLNLTALDIAEAEAGRLALYHRVRAFMEEYQFLLLPVSQVAPFPIEIEWIGEIEGRVLETYIDWMATCYAITLTGLPAISIPCGFTPDGLPIGLQIVGGFRKDLEVLRLAYAFEQATPYGRIRPAMAKME